MGGPGGTNIGAVSRGPTLRCAAPFGPDVGGCLPSLNL